MNKSFTQTDKTMNDKAEISRVPLRARAHALFEHACAHHTLKTFLLNAAVVIAILLGIGAGNRAWGQTKVEVTYETNTTEVPRTGSGTTTDPYSWSWAVPTGVSKVKVHAIGGGGGGGNAQSTRALDRYASAAGGGGGGGYSYVTKTTDEGSSFVIVVGGEVSAYNDGNPSYVNYLFNAVSTEIVRAGGGSKGGNATSNGTNANGGNGGTGTVAGGKGAKGQASDSYGGGGGGAAGPGTSTLQYTAVTVANKNGGSGRTPGGSGGTGGSGLNDRDGHSGSEYGGGGGGAYARGLALGVTSSHSGGSGAAGYVWIEYLKITSYVYNSCAGMSNGTIVASVENAPAGLNYAWYKKNSSNQYVLLTDAPNSATLSNVEAGMYKVKVYNDDFESEMEGIEVIGVPVVSAPTDIAKTDFCEGETVTLNVTGGYGGDDRIVWSETSCPSSAFFEDFRGVLPGHSGCECEQVAGDTLKITTQSSYSGNNRALVNFTTSSFSRANKYLHVRYKVVSAPTNVSSVSAKIEFSTSSNAFSNDGSSRYLGLTLDKDGEWHVAKIAGGDNGTNGWPNSSTITGLRFSCAQSNAVIEIDYIVFSEFPDGNFGSSYTVTNYTLDQPKNIYVTRLGACDPTDCLEKNITVHSLPKITVTNEDDTTQAICPRLDKTSNNITEIHFTCSHADELKCEGLPDGLTFSQSSTNENEYTISGGANTEPGVYPYLVRTLSSYSCKEDTVTGTITIYSMPEIDRIDSTAVSCYADNTPANSGKDADGTITVKLKAGSTTIPYTYSIDYPGALADSNKFSKLVTGTYTVTVTDGNGCYVTGTKFVGAPDKIEVTNRTSNPMTCYDDGYVTMRIKGGRPNYTVTWTGQGGVSGTGSGSEDDVEPTTGENDFFSTPHNLTAQKYTFTVEDSKGCYVSWDTSTIRPKSWTWPTLNDTAITVCSGHPFSLKMNRLISLGEPVYYSWTVAPVYPNTSNMGAANLNYQETIFGTLTNPSTTETNSVKYTVYAKVGDFCKSPDFHVNVTVQPNVASSTPKIYLYPIAGCPKANVNLSAGFKELAEDVTYTVTWKFDGVEVGTTTASAESASDSVVSSFNNFELPDTCVKKPFDYEVILDDGYCSTNKIEKVTVDAGGLVIPISEYDTNEVDCYAAIPAPSEVDLSSNHFKLKCGNYESDDAVVFGEPVTVRAKYNDCKDTITYVYTYKACNDSIAKWKTFFIVADSVKPKIKKEVKVIADVETLVPVVTTPINLDETINFTSCSFVYPDVTELMRGYLEDNCTEASALEITQDPVAGEPITLNNEAQTLYIKVKVVDLCENDTTINDAVKFTVPAQMVLDASMAKAVTCYDSLDGAAEVTVKRNNEVVSASETGLTYKWDNIADSNRAKLENVAAGIHSVEVKDKYDCKVSTWVNITQPSVIRATVVPSSTGLCEGEAITLYASVSGRDDNNYTYAWKNKYADTLMCTTCTSTLSVRDSGTYVLSVIHGTDNCPNNNTDNFSKVQLHKVPQVTIKPSDTAICKNGGVAILKATGMEQVTYRWSSNVASNQITNDSIANVSAPGIYSVTVTSDTSGCSNTAMAVVLVNDPQVTIDNITIYNHIGNDEDDELDEDEEDGYVVCNGTTVKLKADTSNVVGTPTITWKYWKPGDDEDAVPEPSQVSSSTDHPLLRTLTDTTKFKLIVSAQIGKCTVSDSDSVIVNVLPAFNAGTISGGTTVTNEVCYGTSDEKLNLTPITYTEAEGGETPREYRWIHTYNNVSDTTAVSEEPGFTFAGNYGTKPGVHTFIREAKDHSCSGWEQSTGSYQLTVYPQFKGGAISTIGQTICFGDDVNLIGSVTDASGGHGPITYTWYHKKNNETEEALIPNANEPTFDPSDYNQEPGVHYFTRKAANETCNATAPSTGVYVLNVNPVLELNIEGNTTICASGSEDNDTLTLRETNGNTDSYTYLWTTGSNEGATIHSGQSGTVVKAFWPNAGEGHITLTVSNNSTNCVSSRTITVTVNAVPDPVISGNESVCQNSVDFPTAVKLTATPAGLSSYEWIADVGGTYTLGETDDTAKVSWTTVGSHHVSVTVTDGNGCSAKETKEIMVNMLPTLTYQTTSVSCNGGDNGTITATATNGLAPYTYTLVDSAQSNQTGLFEGLKASTSPHHTIEVLDVNGCKARKTGVAIGEFASFTVEIDSIHWTSCADHDGWIWARVTEGSGLFHMGVYDANDNLVGSVGHHYLGEQFKGENLSYDHTYTLKVTADGDPNCVYTQQFYMDKDDTLRIISIPQPPVLCSGEENSFDVVPVVNVTKGTTLYTWAAPDVNPTNGIQNVNAHHNEGQASVHDAGLINTTTGNVQLTYHVVATNGVCQTTGDLVMEVGVTVQPPVTINLGNQPRNVCPEERELTLSAEFGGVVNDETTVTWTFANMGARTHTDVVTTSNNSDTAMIALPNVYNTSYHYTVEFTDGVCTKSEGGDVFVPRKLEMVVDEITNVTCYGGNNGSAVVHAVGGTADYVYSMNGETSALLPGGTSYTFENLPVPTQPRDSTDEWGATKCGDYSIRIKDSKGCIVDTTITICSPAQLEWLNCPEMKVFCCDEGQNYATVVPGNAFTIPTLSTMANVEEITINKAGNNRYTARTNPYTISYVVEDVCNDWEEVICEFKFKVLPNPVLSFDNGDLASQSVCFGNPIQNIQLTFANATISATNLPQGVTLDETTGLISGTPSEPLTTPKTYEFTITAISNQTDAGEGGCGTQTLTGSITVNPTPTISLESTQESCSGNNGTITATITSGTLVPLVRVALDEGTHASWLTDNDKVYNQLQAGTHTVTVWSYDGVTEGCSATATIDVPLNSPYIGETPFVFPPITTPNICSGSDFTATPTAPTFGTYATTYKWAAPTGEVTGGAASATTTETNVSGTLSNGGTAIQNAVYTVTPTTGDVCEGPAFTVTVPVNPTVVMNRPASQTVCSDSTIAAVVFGTPITDGSMSYSWTRTNTTGITGLDESGTGNIAATALKNTTTEAQTTTITVTPTYTYTDGTVSCTGDTVKFTITVNPEVILTANNEANLEQTKTYGTAINDVTFSFSSHATLTHTNLPAGLTFSNNTLSGTPTAAGDHTVTFTATSTQEPNCGKKELKVTIHVEKALLTVTTQDNTKVYGQSDPQPLTTATIDGLVNNDTEAAIRELLQLSFSRATGENVGEYLISATGNSLNNYEVTYQNTGKLSITNAAVTVKAVAQTKTYGAADPTLTATVSGLQHNDAASVITYTVSRVAGENVGEYVITPIGAAVQGNYTVTYDTAKFTITRADLTVKADNKTKPFGTADPTLTATVSGLVNGDAANAISYTLSRAEANTTAGENAGTYVITPTGAAVQGNYNVTYETGTLTITPINITVTVTGNTAVVAYTGSTQSVTGYTAVADNSNYDVSHVVYTGTAIAEGVGSANGDATYPMTLNLNQFSNNDPNYNVTFSKVDGWLRIVPEGTVIVNITGHTLTTNYDAQAHSVSGYDVEIVAPSNTNYSTSDFTFNGQAALNKTNAGVYPMGLAAAQFVNTNTNVDNVIFNVTDGKLTINKVNAEVTITGNHDSRLYDGAEHTIADYVVSNANPAFYTESDFTFSGTATATREDAGTTYMGLADNQFANTNPNFEHVTFHVTDGYQTIQPIQVAVTVTGHTKMHEFTTGLQKVTGYEMESNSALFSKDYVVFSGDSTASGTTVGTYPMGLLASQFSYNNPNLQVTFSVTDGWLEIVPAGIVIVNITGHTSTKDYNCAEQSVSGYEVEIGGVTDDPEPVSYATIYNENYFSLVSTATATAKGTNAGTYYMGLDATKFENNNDQFYVQFHVTDGSLTIKKVNASVTITGKTDEVTYNGAAHTVTGYTVSNAQPTCYNTDYIHFTGSIADSTATRTDFGTTDMNLVPGLFQNTNPNFEVVTFTVVNGKMTVNKASMDIAVNGSNTSRVYTGQLQTYIGAAEATSSNTGFNAAKFGYSGGTTVSGTAAGNYTMALSSSSCSYNDANYNVNWTIGDPVKLTITKAPITLNCPDVNDLTQTYNGSELHPAATAHGVNDQDLIKIEYSTDNGSTWSTTVPGITNVSTQHVDVRASNANYDTVTCDYTLKVEPAAITIKADAKTKVYDNNASTDPGLTATVTGKPANGVDPDYSVSRVAGQTVGEYVISVTAEATSNPNYTVTVDTALFKITPAAITIKADAKSKTYDNNASTDPELTATVTGKPANGVDPDYSVSRVAGQNVGEYVISVTADATSNPNYTVTVDTALFKITPAAITIKADAKTKVYDNDVTTDPGLTATVTGKPTNGVDPVYSLSRTGDQNVGEYVISVTAEATSNPNYTVTVDTALFKITPAAITIKADGKTKVYDNNTNSDPELTATVTGKPANGVTPDYSVSRVAGQNVGEYVISVTAEATSNPNYTVTVDTALFKITPAALTIKVNTEKVYDASPLVTSFGNDGVSIEGNATGAYLTAGAVTTNGSTVGDYTYAANTVTINPAFAMSDGISNYTVSYDITMKIKENELTMYCPVNQADTQKVYDGTPISYTVTAVAGSSNALVEYSTDNNTWSSTTVPSRTDAGETVVYVRASADNYAMKYCHFTLKVTPKPVTVTITGNHDSKTYDATLHTVEGYTATANSTLYVTDDNPDFGLAAGQTAKAIRTTVGTTNMGLTTAMFVNNNPNFDVTFAIAADGYMTITKATLTITANDQTHTYTATAQGENNAIYTSASDLSAKVSVSGLKGNDALTKIKLNGQETNVNVYADKILPSDAAIGTATGNYDINYVAGKLTITRAEATVFANNLSKTYGDADPTLTATVTGVLGTDALNYTLTRDEGDNVGTYAINVTPGSNPNYSVSAQGGQFTIKRRPLTITVNTSKYYDGSALVTSYNDEGVTITGNAGTAQLTAGKVTTNGTAVGTYTNASNATNTVTINTPFAMSDNIQNYSVTTNITMEIQKNTINMTCTDTAKTYDNISFNHPIPATVATGETVTVEYSTNNTTWSGTAPSLTDFGSQTVYVRATADNYEPKTCSYNMTVNKRYVKIITHGGIHLYDGNSFNIPNNYTIEGDGFLEADVVASSFQTPATVTTLGTCVTDTIIYETTSSFKPNDYTIEYQLGQLCISGNAPITITSASVNPNAPIYYDGQLHGTEPQYRTYVVTYDGDIMPTVANSNGLKFKLPAGDTVTITPTFTGVTFYDDVNDTAQNNVFTYTITHDAFYVGTRTVNYGTVNITKRPITFTIDPSLAFKTYDGSILTVNASDLTVGGQGLATGDALTAGVVKTEDYVVGEYTCAEGGFQVGVNGVAIKEGFVITHPSGHNSTSSYVPKFENVKLSITPMTNFECPAAQTFTLVEGTSQMSLTESQLGTPTLEGGAAIPSYVTASSNIAGLTLTEGDHSVTWTFSDANGYEMATCTQTVTVQYAPCDTITYLGYYYPAKRIGSQCWLTENLRADIGADYHSYKDESGNYDKFGYLYSWYTAMGVDEGDVNAVPTPALTADNGTQYFQGICPAGWAVPSMSDIAELSNYVGTVSRLKDPSTQYWLPGYEGDTEGNTDFNARGAGRYNAANNRYEDLMTGFHFWAADATPGSITLLSACIAYHCDTIILTEPNQKNDRKSVRCIRKHVE